MGVIFVVGVIVFAIICLLAAFLVIFVFIKGILNLISNKAYGKVVTCKVIDIIRQDSRGKKAAIRHTKHIAKCEFEYNGTKKELELLILNNVTTKAIKKGDIINCIYNEKKDMLVPMSAEKLNPFIIMCIICGIAMLIDAIFLDDKYPTLIIYIGVVFWYSAIFVFYDPYYEKDKGSYIKLSGRVVDYHYHVDTDGVHYYSYMPEITFKYNDSEETYVSSRASLRRRYQIGQEVDVYYNPETKKIYEKGKNSFCYIMMAIPVVVLIIYVLKNLFLKNYNIVIIYLGEYI